MIKYPVLKALDQERWKELRRLKKTQGWYPIKSYATIREEEDEKSLNEALFVFPYPPTCNHFLQSNGKRRFRTKEYKEFVDAVCKIVGGLKMRKGEYSVDVIQFRSDNRKKVDISNRVKALEDALTQAGLWEDDSLVNNLWTSRGVGCAEVSCVVVKVELDEHYSSNTPEGLGLAPKEQKKTRGKTVKFPRLKGD